MGLVTRQWAQQQHNSGNFPNSYGNCCTHLCDCWFSAEFQKHALIFFSENKNTADLFLDSSFPCGDSWEHPNWVISHGALNEQIWWARDWLGCPACHLIRAKPVSCSDSTSRSLLLLVVVPRMKEQFTSVLPQKQTPELPNIVMLGSKFKKKEWSTNTANITKWLTCDLLVGYIIYCCYFCSL